MGLAVVRGLARDAETRASREAETRASPKARPGPPGHGSPLNYYVPGVCVTGVGVTLPTTGTGCEHEARTLPG
jgi:hypothetical protein